MTSKITKKAFHVPPPSRQEVSMQNHTGKNAFRFSLSILAAAILATTSVTAFAADVAAGTGPGLSVGANSSTAKANQLSARMLQLHPKAALRLSLFRLISLAVRAGLRSGKIQAQSMDQRLLASMTTPGPWGTSISTEQAQAIRMETCSTP